MTDWLTMNESNGTANGHLCTGSRLAGLEMEIGLLCCVAPKKEMKNDGWEEANFNCAHLVVERCNWGDLRIRHRQKLCLINFIQRPMVGMKKRLRLSPRSIACNCPPCWSACKICVWLGREKYLYVRLFNLILAHLHPPVHLLMMIMYDNPVIVHHNYQQRTMRWWEEKFWEVN